MKFTSILKNNRIYFLVQLIWSVIYLGIAFYFLIVAAFSAMPLPFSGQSTQMEWVPLFLMLAELAGFIMLTVLYIIYGKKHLPEWNRKYIAVSCAVMLISFPATLIALKLLGNISNLLHIPFL